MGFVVLRDAVDVVPAVVVAVCCAFVLVDFFCRERVFDVLLDDV